MNFSKRPPPRDRMQSKRVIKNLNDTFIDAAYEGKLNKVTEMLRKGQPVDALHSYTATTALSAAIDRGHYATARTLLKWRADPNLRHPRTGETPLHRAAARGDPKIVKALLENNPPSDRHIISKANQKPMAIAREYQWLEVSDVLREPPSQPMVIDVKMTPHTATFTWNPCLDNGTDIEVYEIVWRVSKYQSHYTTGLDPVTKVKYWHHSETHEEVWAKPKEQEEDPGTHVAKGDDAPVKPGGIYAKHWVRDGTITECNYFIDGLHASYQYFMLLRARSAAGWGVYSRVIPFMCADDITNMPGTPFLWSMTARAITVRWDRPTVENGGHIIHYELHMAKIGKTQETDETGEKCEELDWKSVSHEIRGEPEPQFRVNNLISGGSYCFKVRGRNKTGWSPWGGTSDTLTTNSSPSLLHRSKTSITIHWMDWKLGSEDNLQGFEVQVYDLPDPPDEFDEVDFTGDVQSDDLACRLGIESQEVPNLPWKTITNDMLGTRYLLEGLLPAREFCFRVRTCFKDTGWDGWENAGETKVFKTKDAEPEPPLAPMLVAGMVTHNSTLLRWGDPRCNGQPIDGYKIFYRKCGEEDWTECSDEFIPRRDVEGKANVGIHILPGQHRVTGLEYDTEYEYAIKAHNSCGWSAIGGDSEGQCTLALEPPGAPMCTHRTDTLATITWEPPHLTGRPVDKYELFQRRWRFEGGLYSPSSWVIVAKSKDNVYMTANLKATVAYQFRVRAHTYAADLPAQWSQPSEVSDKVEMLRRL
jgi:hypothetical protein